MKYTSIILILVFMSSCKSRAYINHETSFKDLEVIFKSKGYTQPKNITKLKDHWLNPITFWVSPSNTAVLVNANYPNSNVIQITIGQKGKGVKSLAHWLSQSLKEVKVYVLE